MSQREDQESMSFDACYRRDYGSAALAAGAAAGNWSVGEELAQEAFAEAYRQWDKVSRLDKPGAWVRRVAINRALNQRRSARRGERVVLRLAGSSGSALDDGVPAAHGALWDAVGELAPRQRAAVILHYHDGYSTREIADLLDTSISAVTSSLHKARTRLLTLLGGTP